MVIIQIWIIYIDKTIKTCYFIDMIDDYMIHNLFRRDVNEFLKSDPHLSRLKGLPFVYESTLEEEIPVFTPGIYILTGGRQVGKSTLIKRIIGRLLSEEGVPPNRIYYLPCDTIVDFKQLLFEIEQFRLTLKTGERFFLFIDEASYTKEWDRTIKYLADIGFFSEGSVVVTGSDSVVLKEAMMRFPGRRGKAPRQDFHLYPLSFFEYVRLQEPSLADYFTELRQRFVSDLEITGVNAQIVFKLYEYFDKYLLTGGLITALNDYTINKVISPFVYKTYVQWVLGDLIKRGKQESFLREIVVALIPRMAKQITWHNLTGAMSIDHHQTVSNYIGLLERMDVVFVQQALREDKLSAAPKKARKMGFSDPFIFHALNAWAKGASDMFKIASDLISGESDLKNSLVEGCIASLFKRSWETYYIKSEGEVDIVLIKGRTFFPIEVKRSLSLDKKDLKQIIKYKRGIVAYAGTELRKFEQLDVVPLPLLALTAA